MPTDPHPSDDDSPAPAGESSLALLDDDAAQDGVDDGDGDPETWDDDGSWDPDDWDGTTLSLWDRLSSTSDGTVLWLVATALTVLPFLLALNSVAGAGWAPEGDNAVIGLRASDVFTSNTPLLGQPSTVELYVEGVDAHHLGPMLYWSLSIPVMLFGPTGMLVGTALLNMASVIGVSAIARRLGGLATALLALLVCAVMMWVLGTGFLVDPWNPYIATFPLLCCFFLAWAVASGDGRLLPWAVLVGSFVAQAQVSFILLVGPVLLLAGVRFLVDHVRARRALADEPDALVVERQQFRWSFGLGLAVTAFCWWSVVVEQFTNEPGNLDNLLEAQGSDQLETIGYGQGLKWVTQGFGRPIWLTPNATTESFTFAPSLRTMATFALVVLATVVVGIVGRRRNDRVVTQFALVAMLGMASALIDASSAPRGSELGLYNFRWLWPVGAFVWFGLMAMPLRFLTPAWRRLAEQSVAAVSCAGVVLCLVVFDGISSSELNNGGGMDVITSLGEQVSEALPDDGPYLFKVIGGDLAFYSVWPGLTFQLEQAGIRTQHFDTTLRMYGEGRRYVEGEVQGTIYVKSGSEALTGVPGVPEAELIGWAELVPRPLDPKDDQGAAVYLGPPETAKPPADQGTGALAATSPDATAEPTLTPTPGG